MLLSAIFSALSLFPASAQDIEAPKLTWPVDCELGETCWVARYMDRQPGPEKADYMCKAQTEDKHNGTDIVLRDLGVMKSGVDVRAAAAGRVLALRNGMPDIAVTKERRAQILQQGCGNVLIIGHGGGWQTQYCHLKKDSLLVKKGDRVIAGQPIAQVGLSGITEYPHLHFMVQRRKAKNAIQYYDPFDGGVLEQGCKAATNDEEGSLWSTPINHVGPVVMPPLVADLRVTRQTLWQAQASEMPSDAPVLFIQARGFHTLTGDVWRFSLEGPSGTIKFAHDVKQTRQRQLVGANANFKQPSGGFNVGSWTATVTLLRNGIAMGSAQSNFRISQNQK